MPDNIPLPPDDHDDPFQMFIQHDLDLEELPDEADEGWEAMGEETDEVTPLLLFRPFASPPYPAATHPSFSLPPLTDARWLTGVYTAPHVVAAY